MMCPGGTRCECPQPRYDARKVVGQFVDVVTAAYVLDAEMRSVLRWLQDGLSVHQADRLAVRAGFHPFDLWPSWFDDADAWFAVHVPTTRRRRSRRAVTSVDTVAA